MALYLVTGGAGFIGSHIVETLLERGEQVRVLDNLSTGRRSNVEPFLDRVDFIEGDLRDEDVVRRAVEGVDYVLHQAAIPSVARSVVAPVPTETANVVGTLNLLLAARDAGVRRVVYASSSSVYGDSPVLPKVETMEPRPKSPYGVSKLAMEHYCRVFSELYGLETVGLRYFNVFGPRQDPASQYSAVVPLFVTALLQGRAPTVHGDGLQSRDFTYVSNDVEANLLACTAPGAGGRVFNVACGRRYSLLDLLDVVGRILGVSVAPLHTDPRPGDIKHSLADIGQARECLGFEPAVDFEQGLRRTVRWYQEHASRAG